MPQAIALAIVGLVGLTGVAATLLTAAITIGLTAGLSALLRGVLGPSRAKPSDGQQESRASIGSRYRHYGIVHTSGQLSFFESREGTLAKVLTMGARTAEILEHRIDNKPVTLTGGTVDGDSFHGAVHVYTREGADDQAAIAELAAQFPEWTEDHRQRGCSHAALICDPVKQERFAEVYNNRVPDYTQVRKEGLLYDARLDDTALLGEDEAGEPVYGSGPHRLDDPETWAWSDNWALVIADYWAHPDGYGGGYANVNWANIAREADFCDLAETTVGEETIARWRIWARYGLATDERKTVLADMLAVGDGFCWQDADGLFNLMSGRYEEPDVWLTDAHILALNATLGPDGQQRVSAVKPLYTEAAIGYREQEGATVAVPGAPDDPNTDPQPLPVYFAPHHNQAARLGKIAACQAADDRWQFRVLANLYGLNALGRRFIGVSSAAFGVTARFKIDGLRLLLAECKVDLTLAEVKPGDWAFDAASEEGAPPAAPDTSGSVPSVPTPAGLLLAARQIVLGETNGVGISAEWDDAGRADLVYEARYRPVGGTDDDWLPLTVNSDTRTATSGPIDSGVSYEVQVRSSTIGGRKSDWSDPEALTPEAAAVLTALGPPADLAAIGGAGEAAIRWRNPVQPGFAYAQVFHGASADFDSASQLGGDVAGALGELMEVVDSGLAAGTEYYWALAFDGAGNPSTLAGPVSVTIT